MINTFELLWIIAIILFLVLEGAISGLVSIWFAIGALGGFIAALCNADFTVQISVFVVVSIIAFIFVRKWASKMISKTSDKTDIDRFIGRKVIITENVDNMNNTGKAVINDVEWKVKSSTGETIEVGEEAMVEKIEGVSLIVKKIIK